MRIPIHAYTYSSQKDLIDKTPNLVGLIPDQTERGREAEKQRQMGASSFLSFPGAGSRPPANSKRVQEMSMSMEDLVNTHPSITILAERHQVVLCLHINMNTHILVTSAYQHTYTHTLHTPDRVQRLQPQFDVRHIGHKGLARRTSVRDGPDHADGLWWSGRSDGASQDNPGEASTGIANPR